MDMISSRPELDKIFDLLRSLTLNGPAAYLIGGAVRDMLLKRQVHDLDFVLSEDVRRVARKMANVLDGAFYMLDAERNTARVVLADPELGRLVLDFATLRGSSLEEDLRARDFTINALALDVHAPQVLIDPLEGVQDLKDQYLRMCTPESFLQDPVRVLRGVRQALQLQFHILPDTWRAMQIAGPRLQQVSMERQRDEVFRMACGRGFASALRLLDQLGVLVQLFPEIVQLKEVEQGPPHVHGAWEHTLATVSNLERLLAVLVDEHQEEDVANLHLGVAVTKLGRFRPQLAAHFAQESVPGRPRRGLVKLAGLLHDSGKQGTRRVDTNGRVRFFGHDQQGADLAAGRGHALALSNEEVQRLKLIVRQHMRIHFLANEPQPLARRPIYRFFRDTGAAGIDVCLLSLADVLAVYGPELPMDRWLAELDVVEALLTAWWEQQAEVVEPPSWLSGQDLIAELGMKPGRQMGALLADLKEAQACGQLPGGQQAALEFAREWLKKRS